MVWFKYGFWTDLMQFYDKYFVFLRYSVYTPYPTNSQEYITFFSFALAPLAHSIQHVTAAKPTA